MNVEDQVNSLDEEVVSKAINSKKIGDSKFYLLNDSSRYAPNLRRSHKEAEDHINSYSSKITKEMISDPTFRDFICVNFQEFVNGFLKNENSDRFIEKGEFPSNSVYRVRRVGFKEKGKILDDEGREVLYESLTGHYYNLLSKLTGMKHQDIDLEERLFNPLQKAARIGGFEDFLEVNNRFVELDCKSPKVQSFLLGQQLHKFYERFVIQLISQNENIDEFISDPCFIISPTIHSGKLWGYMELDGFILKSKEDLILIECKNVSREIRQSHITSFVGKARLLEKMYNIEFKKYLVSTGKTDKMSRGMENISFPNIRIFTRKDYRSSYNSLLEDLSN